MVKSLKFDRDLLGPKEVAERLSIGVRTLHKMIERGDFPSPIRFNRKLVRWRIQDVLAFVERMQVRAAS
jgi:excisionase family DNA binding protein